jgi:hypothetical protein
MRLAILMMCAVVAAGVFAAMFLAIWSSRREGSRPASFRQILAAGFVWTAIPCLMILAAAIPAAIAIASSSPGRVGAVYDTGTRRCADQPSHPGGTPVGARHARLPGGFARSRDEMMESDLCRS